MTTNRSIDVDDVDDVIGLALERTLRDAAQLSEAELAEVGAELGLSAEQLGRAVDELHARRAAQAARRVVQGRRRRRAAKIAAAVMGLLIVLGLIAQSGLRTSLAEVERQRAQLASVEQLQRTVQARHLGQARTPEREAELAGADNRVRIERMRYDEAAANYNRRAQGLPGRWLAALAGLPTRAPLSDERAAR